MYCPRCGSWSAQGAAFCWKCGGALAQQHPAPAPGPAPAGPAPATPGAAPGAGPWAQQPPAWPQTPYASYPPPAGALPGNWFYLSASGLATAITVFAAITAVLYGIGAALGLAGAVADDWDTLDVSGGFIGFGLLALLVLFVLLIVWTRRVTGNLLPFQPVLELGTGWAVGSWFVPIISYWFPLRIWNQAWRATTPTIAPPIGWQWKGLPVPITHLLAWVTFHVGVVIAAVGVPTEDDTSTAIGYAGFIGGTLVSVSQVLLILVVRNLTARQDAYARQYLPLVAPAVTPAGPIQRAGG
jgi:hypothetical protein